MKQAAIYAIVPTLIAIFVFYLPVFDIYTVFYLTPLWNGLENLFQTEELFPVYSLLIPALYGILASAVGYTFVRKFIPPQDFLIVSLLPAISLIALSVLTNRYGLSQSAVFLTALALPVFSVLILQKRRIS